MPYHYHTITPFTTTREPCCAFAEFSPTLALHLQPGVKAETLQPHTSLRITPSRPQNTPALPAAISPALNTREKRYNGAPSTTRIKSP